MMVVYDGRLGGIHVYRLEWETEWALTLIIIRVYRTQVLSIKWEEMSRDLFRYFYTYMVIL